MIMEHDVAGLNYALLRIPGYKMCETIIVFVYK